MYFDNNTGSRSSRTTKLYILLGTCGLVVMTSFIVSGCSSTTGKSCNTDADCLDGDNCTTDSCQNSVCSNIPLCMTEQDCDDGDPCTRNDCIFDCCSFSPIECSQGEVCVMGDCVKSCMMDSECDDQDQCTTDTCPNGTCMNVVTVDCDDGNLCTTDSCDSNTGNCLNVAKVCPPAQVCETATGDCVPIICETDSDCDDGLFCNGMETCPDGLPGLDSDCVAGTDPCPSSDCNEATDMCVQAASFPDKTVTVTGTFTMGTGGCATTVAGFTDTLMITVSNGTMTITQPSTGDMNTGTINTDGTFSVSQSSANSLQAETYMGTLNTDCSGTATNMYTDTTGCTSTWQVVFTPQ